MSLIQTTLASSVHSVQQIEESAVDSAYCMEPKASTTFESETFEFRNRIASTHPETSCIAVQDVKTEVDFSVLVSTV